MRFRTVVLLTWASLSPLARAFSCETQFTRLGRALECKIVTRSHATTRLTEYNVVRAFMGDNQMCHAITSVLKAKAAALAPFSRGQLERVCATER